MSELLTLPPRVRPDDRLLLTIVIAAALHAMVVLGVRFTPEAPVKSRFSAMEVVLVPAPGPTSTAVVAGAADTVAADAQEPPLLPMPPVEPPVIKAAPAPSIAPVKVAPTPRPATKSETRAIAPKLPPPVPRAASTAPPDTPAAATLAPPPVPSASQLIARSMQIAADGAGLIEDRTVSGQSASERTLYIKNNSRDWTEIAYSEALRRKAKRFGELFERDVPSGSVGLDVAVASDGSLAGVTITKSSGIEATDSKAVRIIEKAAPYAPLPPEMAKKYDVAHVEFTMNITQDEGFSGGH